MSPFRGMCFVRLTFAGCERSPFYHKFAKSLPHFPRRYNVPPTMPLPKDGVRIVGPMRRGLIPSWAKDAKGGFSTFNARADTVNTKSSFKGAWKSGRRCLILVGGFYEWRRSNDRE
jgi:putative SOS response-associated peptidase YedK